MFQKIVNKNVFRGLRVQILDLIVIYQKYLNAVKVSIVLGDF